MRRLTLVAALLLTACVEDPAQAEGRKMSDADRAACLAAGGTVGQGGLMPEELCFRPMPDAGKACKAAGDCQGTCLADSMTCSEVSPIFGCYEFMDEQGRLTGICVD